MDRTLLVKRVEIIVGVVLIVIVVLGVLFFLFRAATSQDENSNNPQNNLSIDITFLDLSGKKEFSAAGKSIILPGEDTVLTAYNNYSSSSFVCTTECTVYEIEDNGRIFYMSSPVAVQLKDPASDSNIKKNLVISGEEVELTYTQRKFAKAATEDGVDTIEQLPNETQIDEIYGCLSSKVCFGSGQLSEEKDTNILDVEAFEQFVQALVVR